MPQLYCTLSTYVCKTKIYFPPEPKTDTTAQLEKKFLQPTCSECICLSVCHSACLCVRAKRGIWSKRVLIRKIGYFFSSFVEGIVRLFTNFYLHRKLLIFLRNDRDCKAVESLDIFEKLS